MMKQKAVIHNGQQREPAEGTVLYRQEKKEIEREELCREILDNARNELYLEMRYMDSAFAQLFLCVDEQIQGIGTDGMQLFFRKEDILSMYKRNPILVNRAYLHEIFHCLFGHVWKWNNRNRADWNLACDMAVEYLLDHQKLRCVRIPPSAWRREWYRRWDENMGVITAEKLYALLEPMDPSGVEYRRMVQEFRSDDHSRWYENPSSRTQQRKQNWDDIRDKMQTEAEIFSKEASDKNGQLLDLLRIENREKYDYRSFLKKFSVLKEEMQVDPDSFDYIFYHYGVEHYGNMPLIEPLETKEIQKIEDFVIVIDTSMSCRGDLVRRFLEETYRILSQTESFYHRINIRILQCDEKVQEDVCIKNADELHRYMETLELKGFGGTDFRPAFAYVQELQRQKAFHRLRGLLYFTDGYGIYPVKRPGYDVAFVFLEQDYRDVDVPPWAMKLILTEEEIEITEKRPDEKQEYE